MSIVRENPKILVILGPTASGKSDLAVALAKRFKGEIISADSRQVYKGLGIGAGKITKKEMSGIPHYLLDVASPKKVLTAGIYAKLAKKAIEKIIAKGKLPIICGGTGFYIEAALATHPLPEVPPNLALRKKLAKRSKEELLDLLRSLDPERARDIDIHNIPRLARAIEIATTLGKVPLRNKEESYEALKIGLSFPKEELAKRIKKRLLSRMKDGMVAEAKRLRKNRLSFKRMEDLGLEYRYLGRFLQGKISKEEMIAELYKEIVNYAKRQMTWFKRDKNIIWIRNKKEAERAASSFLSI